MPHPHPSPTQQRPPLVPASQIPQHEGEQEGEQEEDGLISRSKRVLLQCKVGRWILKMVGFLALPNTCLLITSMQDTDRFLRLFHVM